MCKKCPSSIGHGYSNTQPSEYEYPPITTRPGLPPLGSIFAYANETAPLDFNNGKDRDSIYESGVWLTGEFA